VQRFCRLFRPAVQCEVVSIVDVAGPTGWDAEIKALVVSKETIAGADAIAKIRKEKSLPPLAVHVIDVISADSHDVLDEDLKNTKLSSTQIRKWLAEQKEKEE